MNTVGFHGPIEAHNVVAGNQQTDGGTQNIDFNTTYHAPGSVYHIYRKNSLKGSWVSCSGCSGDADNGLDYPNGTGIPEVLQEGALQDGSENKIDEGQNGKPEKKGKLRFLVTQNCDIKEVYDPVPPSGETELKQQLDTDLMSKWDLIAKWGNKNGDDPYSKLEKRALAYKAQAFWKERLNCNHAKDEPFQGSHEKPMCTSYWCPRHEEWLRDRSPGWMGHILGPWNKSYRGLSSNFTCKCNKELALEGFRCVRENLDGQQRWPSLTWCCGCPRRIDSNYVRLKWPSIELFFRQPSRQLTYALRPVRVLPRDHTFWMRHKVLDQLKTALERGMVVFPDDRGEDGIEALEFLIINRRVPVLRIFFDQWENLFPQLTFSKRIRYALRKMWLGGVSPEKAELLGKIEPYVDDWDELESCLYAAVRWDDEAGVRKALEELDDVSDIDDLGPIGLAPIHIASFNGQDAILKMLVQAGADVNLRDYKGLTPLMWAAKAGRISCIEFLIDSKCCVHDQTNVGYTALDYAAKGCHEDAVRLMLRHHARLLPVNLWGETLIHHIARSWYHLDHVHFWNPLTAAINIDLEDNSGNSPMYHALRARNAFMARQLYNDGASLNFADGRNILHFAAAYLPSFAFDDMISNMELTSYKGVDVEVKDARGQTPWDTFLMCLYGGPSMSDPYRRTPDINERRKFVKLFQQVRDDNLSIDIVSIRNALDDLAAGDIPTTCLRLFDLSQLKKNCRNEELASWYMDIMYEIEVGDVDSATRKMKDQAQRLRDKLETSPWDEIGPWHQNYLDELDYIENLSESDYFA